MKFLALILLVLSLALTANQAAAWTQKDCDDWLRTHGTVHPDCKGRPTPTPSPTHTPKPTPSATPSPTPTRSPSPTPTVTPTVTPPSRPTYTPGPVCQETPPIMVPCSPIVTPAPLPKRLPNTSTSESDKLAAIVLSAAVLLVGIALIVLAKYDPRD